MKESKKWKTEEKGREDDIDRVKDKNFLFVDEGKRTWEHKHIWTELSFEARDVGEKRRERIKMARKDNWDDR